MSMPRIRAASRLLSLGCSLFVILLSIVVVANGSSRETISVRMPNVKPDHPEQYLCLSHRLEDSDGTGQFIVGFNPVADASRVHHMLMYGCEKPGFYQRDAPSKVWDCSEMQMSKGEGNKQNFPRGPVCQRHDDHVLYGWALKAPALKLPKGVGFKVGGTDTRIKYLVLQVHYGHQHVFSRQPSVTDNSGIILDMRPDKPESGITKQASIYLLLSYGQVLPGKSKHQIRCKMEEDIEIHPFKFRVHTHQLGTKVFGAKLGEKSVMIGVGDPQKPQMFNPVQDKFTTIKKGDTIMAQCEFNNNNTFPINIGLTGNDEMCNYYIMYWTDSPRLLSKSTCYGQNPKVFNY